MQRFFLTAYAFLLFLFSVNNLYAQVHVESYKKNLINLALSKKLYEDRYWKILLHYKKKIYGIESFIDDPKFFLSKNGKYNPQEELVATISSFFEKKVENEDEHAKCKFIARFEWLKEKLSIDESFLPHIECKEFNDVWNRLNARSVSLVFPASYPNSPSSMFGHTLLRLEGEYHSPLLAYAVNYSAIPEDDNPISYTFKGIFGYYRGIYTVMPYYEKVREYSDIEKRDIWEYNLNLTEEEVKKMFLHIWELKDIYQYYYFFDENCSFNILFLLEAARPTLNLTDKLPYWVIPVDTIRAVKEEGLIEKISFRPSLSTKIKFKSDLLKNEHLKVVSSIVDGSLKASTVLKENYDVEDKKQILELAIELLQYKYYKEIISKKDYQKLYYEVLLARSMLPVTEKELKPESYFKPEEGHRSSRLFWGCGIRGDHGFIQLDIRPAYHDLLNDDKGYIAGSQIVFFNFSARYYIKSSSLKLQNWDIVDIISLAPRDHFFKPLSWRVKTGFVRKNFDFNKENIVFHITPGFGLTYKNDLLGIFYTFLNGAIEIGGSYKKNYSHGIGLETGFIKQFLPLWKIMLAIEGTNYYLGDEYKAYKGVFEQTISLKQNHELKISFKREKTFNKYSTDLIIGFNFFF